MVVENNERVAVYPVSTSKFGLGDRWGSMATPLGWLQVAEKIGDHAPPGAVFHKRRFTGEILQPNAPGRDPIVTRIIWLRGLEPSNANAFNRCIYIHGTAEEKSIGKPSSLRLRSNVLERCDRSLLAASGWISRQDHSRFTPQIAKVKRQPGESAKVIFTADAPAGKASAPVANSAPEQKPSARRQVFPPSSLGFSATASSQKAFRSARKSRLRGSTRKDFDRVGLVSIVEPPS